MTEKFSEIITNYSYFENPVDNESPSEVNIIKPVTSDMTTIILNVGITTSLPIRLYNKNISRLTVVINGKFKFYLLKLE